VRFGWALLSFQLNAVSEGLVLSAPGQILRPDVGDGQVPTWLREARVFPQVSGEESLLAESSAALVAFSGAHHSEVGQFGGAEDALAVFAGDHFDDHPEGEFVWIGDVCEDEVWDDDEVLAVGVVLYDQCRLIGTLLVCGHGISCQLRW